MIERRTLQRVEFNQPAMLHLDGIRGVHPCVVMDLHDQGARLHSSTFHTAAFEFDLSFDGFKTTRRCHAVWRDGNSCAVEFVERETSRRAGAGLCYRILASLRARSAGLPVSLRVAGR